MIHAQIVDGLCLLRLDSPPLNAMDLETLGELRAAVRRAGEDAAVRGIVLTGNAEHFSAGADLALFDAIRTADDAMRISRLFQEAFQEIEDCPKPVVAAVAGGVLGGALELAMACHCRVAAAGCRFAMPEVTLGFNPGAGGTQRLPRLVGVPAALGMLLTAKPLNARQALELGLINAVAEPGLLIESARQLLACCEDPCRASQRIEKIADEAANRAALAEAEAKYVGLSSLTDHAGQAGKPDVRSIAPRKIVEAVRAGLEQSFAAGLRAEQRAFADCMATPAARNEIYLFFAKRQTAKVAELAGVEAAPVERVAVVGAGTMGSGIAQAILLSGLAAVVLDADRAALDRAVGRITAALARRVEEGRLTAAGRDAMLARLQATTQWDDLAGVDLAVEAVFENLDVKRGVLARLDAACGDRAVLATNTSTLSLDELAAALRDPARLVGLHFFNPAHRMPLLEVIRSDRTSAGTLATALQFARTLRKTPVVARNREGFLVSRLLVPYLKEAFWLWEEGAEPEAIDRAMVEFGFPMGPLALIDMSGLDILALTDEVLRRAYPWHGPLPAIAARLVACGRLGQKTGSGVYRYEAGGYTPHSCQSARSLAAEVRAGRPVREIGPEEIAQRLTLRMVSEALYIAQEQVARQPADLDVAVTLGLGFPSFRGGVLRYADDLGYPRLLEQLEGLAARCGERFAPCQLLRTKGIQDAPRQSPQGF